jgi:glycosyltransferase involved in cell wall biosynthesis
MGALRKGAARRLRAAVNRTAYILNRYPAVSNTFILGEVRGLRELGVALEAISVRRPLPGGLLAQADREEHARTHYLLPAAPLALIGAHLRALLLAPRRYLATLALAWRMSIPGARSHLWQLFYFAEAVLVWDHCRRRGVTHLHAHFAYVACDDALLAAHLGGWSWSFTMHGPPEFYDVRGTRLAAKVERADVVICVSDFTRSQLMAVVEEAHWSKLHVIRCGIQPARYTPPVRPEPGRDEGLRLLAVGRLVRVKGHAVLLDALAAARAAGLHATLTIVGDGPERDALARKLVRLGLQEHVRLAGAVGQDEMRTEYERADVLCLPSFAEGLPVVLMEAMAMELPVIASAVMGIPELVEHERTGLLVPPGRPDALARALERLAREPLLRASLGRAGRRAVLERHDIRRSAQAVRSLLEAQHPLRVVMLPRLVSSDPYCRLLDDALRRRGVSVQRGGDLDLRFARRARGRLDVVHVHWVEWLFWPGGRSRLRRLVSMYVQGARLLLALRLLRGGGVKLVWTVHNPPSLPNSSYPRLHRALQRALARRADAIAVHSSHAGSVVREKLRPAASVHVVPHGGYVDVYPPPAEERRETRRRLGVPEESFLYLMFGTVRPYKRVPEAIRAFRALEDPDARLLVAGAADDASRREVLAAAGEDPRVRLELRVVPDEEVAALLAAADALVINYEEVFSSGALLLGLAHGLPAVAPAGGSAEEVAPPPASVTFAPGGLTGALAQARRDHEARRMAAREAAAGFNWECVAQRLERIYRGDRAAGQSCSPSGWPTAEAQAAAPPGGDGADEAHRERPHRRHERPSRVQ